MKVLFVVSDYPGHYFPMVPLGWALQAAGHQVRLVCGPAQVATASHTGFPVVGRGTDVDTVLQARIGYFLEARAGLREHSTLPPLHPLTGAEMAGLDDFDWAGYEPEFLRLAGLNGRERTRGIAGLARQWQPDLVIYDLLSPEGLVAAHAAGGVPAVCHLWGPTGTDETGWGLEKLRPDIPAPVRERLGIDVDAELLTHVIDPCPAPIAPATRAVRMPVRYLPYNGQGTAGAPPAATPGRQRVCLVWSNSLTQIFGPASFVVPAVVDAATELGVELVLALSDDDADRLGSVPDGVRVLRRYPISLLLPGSAAVVHHGGAGCLMTAMAAGVPQLALPFGAEQEMIAWRVSAAGAGTVIPGAKADAASIAAALRDLLAEPGFSTAALSLAEQNSRAPTPAALVPALVELALSGRRPSPGPALAAQPG